MPGIGGGRSRTQTTSSSIPKEYKTFAKENLGIAGTIANQPHVQYQGQRIADFSDAQKKGMEYAQSADFGTGSLGKLQNYQAKTGASFMDAYRNPYENDVVQGMQTDARKALAGGLNQLGARAAGGNFGSRLAVSEGVATSEAADNLARNTANLRHQGFTTAAGLGQQDAQRDLSGANLRMSAAQALAQAQQAKAAAMMGTGGLQQQQDQRNMDLAYGDFLEQQNDPLRKLSIRMGALGQTPMGSVQRGPAQRRGANIGGLLSGAGTFASGLGDMKFCWVAREVYGAENPKWLTFRRWMISDAPRWLFRLYARHGEAFAAWISDKPRLKAAIRLIMDRVAGGA